VKIPAKIKHLLLKDDRWQFLLFLTALVGYMAFFGLMVSWVFAGHLDQALIILGAANLLHMIGAVFIWKKLQSENQLIFYQAFSEYLMFAVCFGSAFFLGMYLASKDKSFGIYVKGLSIYFVFTLQLVSLFAAGSYKRADYTEQRCRSS